MPEETSGQQQAAPLNRGRASTGINGLDLALDGGFLPGSTILVIGSPTSGLDRFARQFWAISPATRDLFMLDGFAEEGMIPARGMPADGILHGGGKGIIVDSLSTLIMRDGIDPVLSGVVSSRESVRSAQENAFFILYRGLHALYNEILLIRHCDVVIELHEEIRGNEIIRALEVKKILGLQIPGRVLPFIVTATGIELSTTSRVV